MHTTLSLLESLKSHYENCSDYALGPIIGISKNTISGWRCEGAVMKDETGRKAAQALGLCEEEVLISLAAERAKGTPIAAIWKTAYNRLAA